MPSLEHGPNPELVDMQQRMIVSIVLGVPLVIFDMGLHAGYFHALMAEAHWIEVMLATPVVLWCGAPFFQRGWASLVTRHLNMFTLIALGTGLAWGYSLVAMLAPQIFPAGFRDAMGEVPVYFEAAAVITLLVLVGQVLELKARERTGDAIRALLDLAPKVARRLAPDGEEHDVPLAEIVAGDQLRVRPGEQVPVDGTILSGEGTIDQSMMTGEPVPVRHVTGETVMAATLNQAGSFVMRADKVGAETTLSRIVQLVADAQRSRAPVQALVDQVAAWFVPLVLGIAVLAFIAWIVVGPEPRFAHALVAAISVLIIACPCALGLATPMSVMVGMGRGARAGVLLRDAEALQVMERVDTLVIDKTGTLTEGHPSLVAISVAPSYAEENALRFAASLERGSEHPLAAAIVTAATTRGIDIPSCTDFANVNGMGASGLVDGQRVRIGSARFLSENGVEVSGFDTSAKTYAEDGATVIHLSVDDKAAAIFMLADKIKTSAAQALLQLREQGLHVIMASGDGKATAEAVARTLGIDEVLAEALPDDKAALIKKLRNEGRVVAMAGDGINDAPALAAAQIGIAMGTGSDIAMQSAGVTLLHGDLNGFAYRNGSAQPFPQRLAVEQLHDDERMSVMHSRIEHIDDVWMGERSDGLRFAFEALAPPQIVRERLRQHFDRNVTPEARVPRAIDLAHAARADGRDDFVGAEARAGGQTHLFTGASRRSSSNQLVTRFNFEPFCCDESSTRNRFRSLVTSQVVVDPCRNSSRGWLARNDGAAVTSTVMSLAVGALAQ